MSLRPALQPPTIEAGALDRMTEIVGLIAEAWETGEPVDGLMREHDALAGREDVPARHYRDLCSRCEKRDAAFQALCGRAPIVPDISREELIEVVRRIQGAPMARDMIWWLDLYRGNTPARDGWDPLVWPDPDWLARIGTDEPTPEQIVDEALRRT